MYHLQALQERATINILDLPFAGVTTKRYYKYLKSFLKLFAMAKS